MKDVEDLVGKLVIAEREVFARGKQIFVGRLSMYDPSGPGYFWLEPGYMVISGHAKMRPEHSSEIWVAKKFFVEEDQEGLGYFLNQHGILWGKGRIIQYDSKNLSNSAANHLRYNKKEAGELLEMISRELG